jgi:hypothetical protein
MPGPEITRLRTRGFLAAVCKISTDGRERRSIVRGQYNVMKLIVWASTVLGDSGTKAPTPDIYQMISRLRRTVTTLSSPANPFINKKKKKKLSKEVSRLPRIGGKRKER